ncbi:hypothetical protein PsYK624_058730 [Phanerochaete sordida]|uniref:Uncharacterized protein n=1 Tax=Phanerochaete sordida TaxID=48140 RepID=A0A9P3G7K2_9APHY|nr:hypothetical protein PsYK624_058730 [Phanerochaete sordida]
MTGKKQRTQWRPKQRSAAQQAQILNIRLKREKNAKENTPSQPSSPAYHQHPRTTRQHELQAVHEERRAALDQLSAVEHKILVKDQQIALLEDSADAAAAYIEDQQDELRKLNTKLQQSRRERNNARARANRVIKSKTSKHEQDLRTIEDFDARHSRLLDDHTSLQYDYAALREHLSATNSTARQTVQELERSQTLAQELAARLSDSRLATQRSIESLAVATTQRDAAVSELAVYQHLLDETSLDLSRARQQSSRLSGDLGNLQSRYMRTSLELEAAHAAADTARQDVASASAAMNSALSWAQTVSETCTTGALDAREEATTLREKVSDLQQTLTDVRRTNRSLKAKVSRAPQIREKAVAKAKTDCEKELKTFRIKSKGTYTPEARTMALRLVQHGCAQENVGDAMQDIGAMMGVAVLHAPSRRSVGRFLLEGGVAATVQLGFEIENSPDITISGDGTTHRNVGKEARNVTVLVPDSYAEPSHLSHKNRLVGVDTAIDHKSQTQFEGWQSKMTHIFDTFNRSPLAAQQAAHLELSDFARKLLGMHTDHAEDQRKLERTFRQWKKLVARHDLGTASLENPTPEVQKLIASANEEKIRNLGGLEAWRALSADEQAAHDVEMIQRLAESLGDLAYAALDAELQRQLDLFFWAGCCMHKELNSVKGGNAGLVEYWKALGHSAPVLLPNRDNRAVVELADASLAETSPAERRAALVSSGGAVKLASLAGSIFNHKDSKKGQHDTYLYHFLQLTGRTLTFPDTSNTRYQSYCLASAELLTHRLIYIQFLELVRDKKDARNFNNMEANVYQGLHDLSTLTEMVVFAWYGEAISYPYAAIVRGPGSEHLNALELGDFHAYVRKHLQKLIDNPTLILSPDAEPASATLDGSVEWRHPNAVAAMHELAPTMPHLQPLLVAFFKGALATWERFCGEFAPGGIIDTSTAQERHRAWMQPCNDACEGILGTYRRFYEAKPSTSEHQFNALMTYQRNGTEDFAKHMLADDANQQFLRREARRIDGSGLERLRKSKLAEVEQATVAEKRAKERAKAEKLAAKLAKLAQLDLIVDEARLRAMNVKELDAQLDKHRSFKEDTAIPLKSHLKNKGQKLAELLQAVARYQTRHSHALGDDEMESAAHPDGGNMTLQKDCEDAVYDEESDYEE